MSWPRSPCSRVWSRWSWHEAGDGDEILLVELGDADELLGDQLDLALLCLPAAPSGRGSPRWSARSARATASAGRCARCVRDSNSFCSPAIAVATDASSRPLRQLRRKHDDIGVVALGQQARLAAPCSSSSWERTTPSVALVTVSSSRSTIWPASTSLALLDQDLPDHAAGRVLHLLDVRFDHDGAGRDHRAGQLGGRRPAADAADEQHGDRQSHEIELADRAARVLLGRVTSGLRPWCR